MPSIARTEIWCEPGVASHRNSHWTHVAFEIGAESVAGSHGAVVDLDLDAAEPRSGAQATPAIGTEPALSRSPEAGTSIRDCVRIGARSAQPSGTQYPWNWSKRVSSSSVSHFVAET